MNLHRLATAVRLLVPVVHAVADALDAEDVDHGPAFVTQNNVEATVGIGAQKFLEIVRSARFPLKVTKVGAARAVDRLAFLRWLQEDGALRLGEPANETAPDEADEHDPGLALLDKLGVELVPRTVQKSRR